MRVGPVGHGMANKYLGDEGIFQKPVPVFCVQDFLQGKNTDELTSTGFFDVCYVSCEGKTGTGFSARTT